MENGSPPPAMDGEYLYDWFKASLNHLGPGFRGMDQVSVYTRDGKLCLGYGFKEVSITLPVKDKA